METVNEELLQLLLGYVDLRKLKENMRMNLQIGQLHNRRTDLF